MTLDNKNPQPKHPHHQHIWKSLYFYMSKDIPIYVPTTKVLVQTFFWKKYGWRIPYLPTAWTYVQTFVVFFIGPSPQEYSDIHLMFLLAQKISRKSSGNLLAIYGQFLGNLNILWAVYLISRQSLCNFKAISMQSLGNLQAISKQSF